MIAIKREQRRRIKGYKSPPKCHSCVRPGPLGNYQRDAYDFRLWATFSVRNLPEHLNVKQGQFRMRLDELVKQIKVGEIDTLSCYCAADSPNCHLVPLIELVQERLK